MERSSTTNPPPTASSPDIIQPRQAPHPDPPHAAPGDGIGALLPGGPPHLLYQLIPPPAAAAALNPLLLDSAADQCYPPHRGRPHGHEQALIMSSSMPDHTAPPPTINTLPPLQQLYQPPPPYVLDMYHHQPHLHDHVEMPIIPPHHDWMLPQQRLFQPHYQQNIHANSVGGGGGGDVGGGPPPPPQPHHHYHLLQPAAAPYHPGAHSQQHTTLNANPGASVLLPNTSSITAANQCLNADPAIMLLSPSDQVLHDPLQAITRIYNNTSGGGNNSPSSLADTNNTNASSDRGIELQLYDQSGRRTGIMANQYEQRQQLLLRFTGGGGIHGSNDPLLLRASASAASTVSAATASSSTAVVNPSMTMTYGSRNPEQVPVQMEGACTPRPRWCPTQEQIQILESIFNAGTTTPSREMIVDIAGQLRRFGNIAEANVFYWFQNRKARAKRKLHQQPPPPQAAPPSSSSPPTPPPPASSSMTVSTASKPPTPVSSSANISASVSPSIEVPGTAPQSALLSPPSPAFTEYRQTVGQAGPRLLKSLSVGNIINPSANTSDAVVQPELQSSKTRRMSDGGTKSASFQTRGNNEHEFDRAPSSISGSMFGGAAMTNKSVRSNNAAQFDHIRDLFSSSSSSSSPTSNRATGLNVLMPAGGSGSGQVNLIDPRISLSLAPPAASAAHHHQFHPQQQQQQQQQQQSLQLIHHQPQLVMNIPVQAPAALQMDAMPSASYNVTIKDSSAVREYPMFDSDFFSSAQIPAQSSAGDGDGNDHHHRHHAHHQHHHQQQQQQQQQQFMAARFDHNSDDNVNQSDHLDNPSNVQSSAHQQQQQQQRQQQQQQQQLEFWDGLDPATAAAHHHSHGWGAGPANKKN